MRGTQTFVILMLLSISLAGCLENSSSSNSAESTNSETVFLDVILDCTSLEIDTQTTTLANGSVSETIVGVNATLYHAMYSASAPSMSLHYDIDLDGIGDIFNNNSRGITSVSIPISSFVTISQDRFLTTIAATASTANVEKSELVHISNDCSVLSQIDLAQLTVTSGDFSMYDFSVTDASGTPTSAGEEALVFIAMDNGDDLSWASVIVQLSADDGVYTTCTNPNEAVDTGCAVGDNDDGSWTFGEEVTVSEGSSDICAGPCSVQVKVLDRSSNKLIYESTVVSVL